MLATLASVGTQHRRSFLNEAVYKPRSPSCTERAPRDQKRLTSGPGAMVSAMERGT